MSSPADRLKVLYDVARSITSFTDLDPLLRFATRRARELLQAEGCAVLLLDEDRGQLFFPVASQAASSSAVAERLGEVAFPASRGVAGWVLAHDQAVLVADAASDPRFYPGVDQATGLVTRALLCAPLRTRGGNIGVVEVVDPRPGHFVPEDVPFLEALAADIAIACEKARLYERLRHETLGLRQLCGLTGLVLCALGIVFAGGAAYAHLAHALPLRELMARPALLTGVLMLGAGAILAAVGRGWLVAPTSEPEPL